MSVRVLRLDKRGRDRYEVVKIVYPSALGEILKGWKKIVCEVRIVAGKRPYFEKAVKHSDQPRGVDEGKTFA